MQDTEGLNIHKKEENIMRLNLLGLGTTPKEPTFPVNSVTFLRFYCGPVGKEKDTPISGFAALSHGTFKDAPCEHRVVADIVRSAPEDAYAFQIITAMRLRGLVGHKTKIQPPADPVWIGELDERNFQLKTRSGQHICLSSLAHVYTPAGERSLPKVSEAGAAVFAQYIPPQALRR